MRIRNLVSCISLFLGVVSLHAAPTANPSAGFTLTNTSHIPGATLKPGAYTIQVVNHLSDRVVLRVDDSKGKVHATFLGVSNKEIPKPSDNGQVTWANPVGKANYMQGWYFPDSPAVIEFVYPKAEAVSIATANPAKVPAVDPASEGKAADKTLARDDLQVLTLWTLSLQEVGSGAQTGEIKAERYQQTASVADYRPAIKALPHTASLMPVVWILGFGMLLLAGCLRWCQRVQRSRLSLSAIVGRE